MKYIIITSRDPRITKYPTIHIFTYIYIYIGLTIHGLYKSVSYFLLYSFINMYVYGKKIV